MTIEITTNEFNPEIREMFDNKLFESISIDYMYNAVMGWSEGVEYVIIDFDKYFRLDNRFNTYELETYSDKIVIDIR
jgi:hypothetical protein